MEGNKKPNIIFILSDDQGTFSLGSYGNKEIKTPALDKLAEEGTRFENFFCTSPVCSPARASILTGKMPSGHGILDWLGGGSVYKEDFKGLQIPYKSSIPYLESPPENKEDIPDDETIGFEETINYKRFMNFEKGPIPFLEDHLTYTEILAARGYECGIVGKWHLGDSYKKQKGFSFWEIIARGGTNYMVPEYIRNGKSKIEEGYVTDIITDDAIRFLEEDRDKDKPFYLSIHYTAPHSPWEEEDQPRDVWERYNDCKFEDIPNLPPHPWQNKRQDRPRDGDHRKKLIQGYYTCVSAMDDNIQRILTYLDNKGLADNTIIFFLSDNGFNLGHHGIWGKGNGTFPLNMYETSVKVPCIIRGPNIREGQVKKTLVSQYDIFPTILDLTGSIDDELDRYIKDLPGKSLVPILTRGADHIRDEVVVFDEYGPVRMIRDEGFKLIYRSPYGPHELYDLEEDPNEENNLFDDINHRKKKVELFKKLEAWFEKYTVEKYDGRRYPVTGRGQMERLEKYGEETVVFRTF